MSSKRSQNNQMQVTKTNGKRRRRSSSAREKARRTGLLFEHLEIRSLLAADLMADFQLTAGDLYPTDQQVGAADVGVTSLAQVAEGEGVAEGEDQPDLVAFAKALDQAGVKYYGGAWCAHCSEQKKLFEDGSDFVPFIEVTNPDRTLNQIGLDNNISSLPTWVFPDTTRLEGMQTLQTISDRSGVAIPTSSLPSLAPIDDVTVLGGAPLHIPLDGYDPNGGPLTYTISIDNSVLSGDLLEGNRSMRIDAGTYGDMVFQLFEGRAERPTERVIELAQDDFYDGIIFHRVIDGFVIQGGDPTGTGSGGSTLGDFDDQFHVDLQHTSMGVLSYAKSGDDTNDSQFFVTLGPTRHLDFNHSVFGILVEGYHQLESIGSTATGSGDRPTFDIAMNTVDIFTDTENGVLMLSAAEGATGSANVTVTVTDEDGNTSQETFHVNVIADTSNGGPFLEDIDPITVGFNTPAQIQLSGIDVEGDAVFYDASATGSVASTVVVNSETGLVTVTPPTGFQGELQVSVGVRALNGSDTSDVWDQQLVTITVEGEANPLGVPTLDLLAGSDSNIDTDNVTNVTNMTFRVTDVVDGAVVRILSGSTVIGQGTVNGTSIDIATDNLAALGDDVYTLTATQTLGSETSLASDPLEVTLDTTDPADFTSIAPTAGVVGHFLRYNAQHADEGTTALTYSLAGAPSGAVIDPETGVLTWTPAANQAGTNTFQIVGTDLAGNTVTQDVSIAVVDVQQVMHIRLEVQSMDGAVIDTISPGQNFWLRVYVQDVRTVDADGVFAAYLDVNYNSTVVSAVGQNRDDIVYGDEYQNGRSGVLTTPGLMDEIGAFGPTSSLDGTERLLLMVGMKADAEGVVQFYGDPGDAIGSDALVFGVNQPLDWDVVTILPTTLTVTAGITANDDLYNVDEDSENNNLPVLDNDDNEVNGDPIVTAVGATNHGGTVTIAANGQSVIYTPAADFFGEEEFTYTSSLGSVQSTATVTVQVFPVNDAPTANDDDFEVSTDSDDNFLNVLGNDEIAPDTNETVRVSAVGTPAHGTVQIAPNGTHLLYTPEAGYEGTDTFSYTIIDGTGTGALTSQGTVTVTSVRALTAGNDEITVLEDSDATEIDVLDNDSPEQTGAALTIDSVSTPSGGGQVTIIDSGQKVTYKPSADFQGTDTFTYTVRETGGETKTATVTVHVTNVNDPPTANDDLYDFNELIEGTTETLEVLDNDSLLPDPDGTLVITGVTQGSDGGTVAIATDGLSILYTPQSGFNGIETFTYTLDDGSGETATATVTVTDLPSPTVGNDTAVVLEDSNATEIDVLANDAPEQTGAALTIQGVSTPSGGGQVTIIDSGQKITYKPSANFQGTDTFTYTVREANGGTTTATVTVTVTNVNDPPTANNDEYSVVIDTGTQTLDVLDNDSLLPDPDGTLVITGVTQGSNGGTVSITTGGGSIRYTPQTGFQGTETFTYTLDDGSGETATATVTVNVLEYVPRTFSGAARLSGVNGIGGLRFALSGTDDFDANVSLYATSLNDGSFSFANLAPGTYEISRDSSVFLLDADVMRITVQSAMDDTDSTGNTFESPGRKAKYMTIADLLVTAPQQSPLSPTDSVTIAVEPGVGDHWYEVHAGWEEYVSAGFELSDDLSELTINVVDDAGVEFTGTVDTSDTSMVKWLGEESGAYLLRLDATPDQIGLTATGGSGEAEGEGVATTPLIVSAASTSAVADESTPADAAMGGEGESSPSLAPLTFNTLQVVSQPAASVPTVPVSDVVDTTSAVDSPNTTSNRSTWTEGASTPVSTTASADALAAVDAVVVEEAFRPEADSSVVDEIAESDESDDREIVIDTIFAEDSLFVSV